MVDMSVEVGLIIIGRNEGDRLRAALNSCLAEKNVVCLYVDSGSTDGSAGLARTIGVAVHQLNTDRPFSAARARKEGVDILQETHPGLKYFQFLDGDCTLESGWIEEAVNYLEQNESIALVCGTMEEAAPSRSIYNKLNALQWNVSPGEINACGGVFMIRRVVYEETGGFNDSLLTGEEPELCSRIRAAGHRIMRLDLTMACHDSGFVCFADWWKRAVWGGYGDAVEYESLNVRVTQQRRRETRSNLFWGFFAPLFALGGMLGIFWSFWFVVIPLVCGLGYLALFIKILLNRLKNADAVSDAMTYAFFCILRKAPNAIGFLQYKFNLRGLHKRPDPHATSAFRVAPDRE